MAVTRYAVSGTGVACGPGTRYPLSETIGSSVATQDLANEHTWNVEFASAYSVAAGTWTVVAWVTVGSGGGQPNRITATVRRMNGSCVQQEVIATEQSGNLNAGETQEVTFTFADLPQVDFAAGDRLLVQFARTNGGRTTTLRFDHDTANTAETRVVHPDEAAGATPTRGQVSWAEAEVPSVLTRGRVSWAEVEAPTTLTRGRISWTEAEVPDAAATPTRGRISWSEAEAPFVAARGRLSWAEAEVPLVSTRGRLSWAEAETPTTATRGRLSWAEVEVPSESGPDPTRGRISWGEMESPLVQARGRVSWAEQEAPIVATRGRISWSESEAPIASTAARLSNTDFESPAGGETKYRHISGMAVY